MQGKKKRDTDIAETARKALLASQGLDGETAPKVPDAVEQFDEGDGEEQQGGGDLLSGKDADVIF